MIFHRGLKLIRRFLDGLYLACGVVAAIFLIAILILITLQMIARWTGEIFPGSTDYAGYCMAASTFFAFAYALNNGSHIRVNLLLGVMGEHRRWGETWCFGVGTILAAYWCYSSIKSVYWSFILKDVSQGLDATPVWIPQLSMAIGSLVFAIALADNLVRVVATGRHDAYSREIGSSGG